MSGGSKLSRWGNALYTGEKSYAIVQHGGKWVALAALLVVLSIGVLFFKGLNPGIDFRGGTEYTISGVAQVDTQIAIDVIAREVPGDTPRVTVVGGNNIRVQLGTIPQEDVLHIAAELAEAYGVPVDNVTSTSIGPTWGASVSGKAIQGLVIFMVLVTLVIAAYFRAWRMAIAAVLSMLINLIFTAGIYALVGFEVTPATVIGFLTILAYALYDCVVVFDKVRENTDHLTAQNRYTYGELANLAVNQTLVRSINTSVVALLPVGSILVIGAVVLGAGTLQDIALVLFVGMAVGTFSSIYMATPIAVALREREDVIKEHTAKVLALRESGEVPVTVNEDGAVRVGALKPGQHLGTTAQPRRKGRK